VGVLAGMGFKQAQIEPALKKLKNAPTENFDEMVRLALVNLAA
jgi:Holliday junction resolvasome RuvABC DNA-binding subunit